MQQLVLRTLLMSSLTWPLQHPFFKATLRIGPVQAYVSVAERVWAKLQQSASGEGGQQARGPPKIVFE